MSIRPRHAVQHAINAIKEYIRAHNLGAGSELPSLKTLASSANVSLVTMWAAMDELKNQGVVKGSRGHPFHVGLPAGKPVSETSSHPQLLSMQSTAWLRTEEKIRQDILDGNFMPGTKLPSAKELESRYGVSYRTLAKALNAMSNARMLKHSKKGYMVPSFTARGWRPRIIFMAFSFDMSTMYLAQHDQEFFKSLEKLCAAAHIAFDIFLIFPKSLDPGVPEHHLVRDRRSGRIYEIGDLTRLDVSSIIGFMLLIPTQPKTLEGNLLRALAPHRKPVAILDEAAGWQLPHDLKHSSLMRMFTITASTKPAETIGRYLMELGHRKIAFFSPYHGYTWSQRRIAGLKEVYEKAGEGCSVTAFTDEEKNAVPADISAIRASYESLRKKLSPAVQIDFSAQIDFMEQSTVRKAAIRSVLYKLFGRAMHDRAITAWVAVNDETALMALDFLKAKGINVPSDISVISFDDSESALRLNLTSYNFNAAGVAGAMLGYILKQMPFAEKNNRKILEISGYIAERHTTAELTRR